MAVRARRVRGARKIGAPAPPTVSVRMLRICAEALERKGFDVASFLKGLSVERSALDDVDGRVPIDVDLALWGAAALISGDENFGLHAGAELRPEALDVLGYTLGASADIGQAFRRLVRYNRVLHDAAELELYEGPEEARIEFSLTPGGTPRHQAEFSFTVFVSFCRYATGVDVTPVRVEFSHPAPSDISEHRRIFRAPLLFGKPRNALVLPREALAMPLLTANPGLGAVLERQLKGLLADLPSGETMLDRVKRLIAAELCEGEPTADVVARRMRTTPRTLHRWLSAEGTSYRDILNDLRRDLAFRYLAEDRLAIGETAYLLGFSDPSAFHRSFRRWTGQTPAEYRAAASR
jgi:AraC-like DNA-binding protein